MQLPPLASFRRVRPTRAGCEKRVHSSLGRRALTLIGYCILRCEQDCGFSCSWPVAAMAEGAHRSHSLARSRCHREWVHLVSSAFCRVFSGSSSFWNSLSLQPSFAAALVWAPFFFWSAVARSCHGLALRAGSQDLVQFTWP